MAKPHPKLLATVAAFVFLLTSCCLFGDARFDLAGPPIDIHVTRGGVTLPIAEVPNLQPGDRLWLHPDFPSTQSVHYILVAAFLRGTTNPPPDDWFARIETWKPKVRREGVFITVPAEAQQVLLFLAPETAGDFATLRSAVKGRPGIFVRASQDLNAAGFEEGRIQRYLEGMRTIQSGDAKELLDHSNLLARSLALKPNPDCFKLPVDQQYNCLTQSGNQLLLDDGHGQSVADNLTTGASNDFINAASYTSIGGGGLYSAYVGAIIDLVHLTSTLHTAQYQYIPAIAFPSAEQLNLRLNAAPSFHNPKSVIVIGLPAIQAAPPPPLRAANPDHVACLLKPNLVLGLVGAPLVYSTSFAHDLVLHLNTAVPTADIPLTADAFRGGLVLAPAPSRVPLPVSQPPDSPKASAEEAPTRLTGTVKGRWGFDTYTGATLPLQQVPGEGWRLVTSEPLIAGEDNHLELASTGSACVDTIIAKAENRANGDVFSGPANTEKPLEWKAVPAAPEQPQGAVAPDRIALTLPLRLPIPDAVRLEIRQFGDPKPTVLTAKALSEPALLSGLKLHAADSTAVLTGTSLAQVKQVTVGAALFAPTPTAVIELNLSGGPTAVATEELHLALDPASTATGLKAGEHLNAAVTLKDGRVLHLPVTIAPARPVLALLSRNVEDSTSAGAATAHIEISADEVPLSARFTFFLKSAESFPRGEQVEIASVDDALHTTLSIAAGSLVLENKHTVLATIEPLKLFGPSAFGPLRLRAIAPDGTAGDWLSLATLVRLPTLTELRCPAHAKLQPCLLIGSDLYLIDSVSATADFASPTAVPEGLMSTAIAIPRPAEDTVYLRLRDDPTANDHVRLPIVTLPAGLEPPTESPDVKLQ